MTGPKLSPIAVSRACTSAAALSEVSKRSVPARRLTVNPAPSAAVRSFCTLLLSAPVPPMRITVPPGASTRLISTSTLGSRIVGGVSSSGPPYTPASGTPDSASGNRSPRASTTAAAPWAGKVLNDAAIAVAYRSEPPMRVA